MKSIVLYLLCLTGLGIAQNDSARTLIVDHAPADMVAAPIEVQVRQQGAGEWRPLFVYHADSMSKQVHDYGGAEGFVKFAFSGEV